nr:hypothetical protein [Cellvibrio mixtus]
MGLATGIALIKYPLSPVAKYMLSILLENAGNATFQSGISPLASYPAEATVGSVELY